MYKSRYEHLVVRKPNVMRGKNTEMAVEKVESLAPGVDTGPLVLCSRKLLKNSNMGFEWGIISKDHIVGNDDTPESEGGRMQPHKDVGHDHMICFLGTNPDDPSDLGGEVEFWLGEGKELDKVVINTSSSVYIPEGLAMFPMKFKNVKRPFIMCVVASSEIDKETEIQIPVSMEGRPRTL
jgi:hypothetical protein